MSSAPREAMVPLTRWQYSVSYTHLTLPTNSKV